MRAVEPALRALTASLPTTTVIANYDDPLVASAALAAARTL
ncbi:hypothetical protein [Amycolatopsis sp. NPDC051372]